jgi:presenilin-like A22 family membrane protease
MKKSWKIPLILLTIFLVTQVLGYFVTQSYFIEGKELPVIFQNTPSEELSTLNFFITLIPSFVIAILLIMIIMKYKLNKAIKIWFSLIVLTGIFITLYAFSSLIWVVLTISIILTALKILRPTIISHNLTEILVYPGIAVIFIQWLTHFAMLLFLLAISFYDLWAVWHSEFMMNVAKYQMQTLKVLGGILIPTITKKQKQQLKKYKEKGKNPKNIKIKTAILGGGDIIFPIIATGVMYLSFGLPTAILTTLGATLGLLYIFLFGEEKRPYPAMPFITLGIFVGLLISLFLI